LKKKKKKKRKKERNTLAKHRNLFSHHTEIKIPLSELIKDTEKEQKKTIFKQM